MEAKLTMKVKTILEDELLNWEIIEKWSIIEVDELLWQYLLRAYWDRREKVDEEIEVEEDNEEEDNEETTDEEETEESNEEEQTDEEDEEEETETTEENTEETTEEETTEEWEETEEEVIVPKSTRSRK